MRPNYPKLPARLLSSAVLTLAALVPSATLLADQPIAPTTATESGTWVDHKYHFVAMGFTSTYSCIGLIDKLRLMLRTSGARVQELTPLCSRGFDRPDRLAQVDIRFATLQPEAGAANGSMGSAGSAGAWKRVELAPRHPNDLQDGDCELVDQFRSALLPMFAARDLHNNLRCVPNQDLGPFSLSFEVFAPAGANRK